MSQLKRQYLQENTTFSVRNNYKLIQAVEELPTLIVVLPFNIIYVIL
jgi:hypothetical protein